jgi:hypothetical protein
MAATEDRLIFSDVEGLAFARRAMSGILLLHPRKSKIYA